MVGSSIEQSMDDTPIQRSSLAERHDAAISLAEVALARKWTEPFRIKTMQLVLAELDITPEVLQEEETDGSNT